MAGKGENGAEGVEMINCSNQEASHQQEALAAAGDLEMNMNGNSTVQGSSELCICRQQIEYRPSGQKLAGDYRKMRIDLYKAALNGDWRTAKSIVKGNLELLTNFSITEDFKTALHVAVGAKQTAFVKKLVTLMKNQKRDLELQDMNRNTAFCHAIIANSIPIAKILMNMNQDLALIRGGQNSTPLFIAVIFECHEMARFLYRETKDHIDHLEPEDLQELFFTCVKNNMFDIASKLLKKCGDLAVARKRDGQTALHLLAQKPLAFASKSPRIVKMLSNLYKGSKDITAFQLFTRLWEIMLSKIDNIRPEICTPFNVLFKAAELGNYEFVAELIRLYPELVWETDNENRTIFHIAVLHRQVNIFNQIYSTGSIKDVVVTYKIPRLNPEASDNILHLAAYMPSPHRLNTVSGAALQMQRELLWFEEVKSILKPSDREETGLELLTPRKLFSREHKELLEKGEKWMRETSNSCMLVATLIATVVYSAGFSIPGGNNDRNGAPVQINHTLFHVFAILEGVALSFSITSMLMFLCILTSRYAEEDFLKSLPLKLMAGLTTLIISMMAMVAAFSVAFLLAYRDTYNQRKVRWVPLLVSALVLLPATSFVLLQYRLLRDIFYSIFCSHSLFQPKKPVFCFRLRQLKSIVIEKFKVFVSKLSVDN